MKTASELLKERLKTLQTASQETKTNEFDRAYESGFQAAIELIEFWEKLEEPYKKEQ